MSLDKKILLVGCGKMGEGLLAGWVGNDISSPENITLVEPHMGGLNSHDAILFLNVNDVPEDYKPDIIIFAVKPQIMEKVLPSYKRFISKSTLLISIAAGKKIGFIEGVFGKENSVIRIMPNLPATIGKGVSIGIANGNVSSKNKKICKELFESVGSFNFIDDEKLMDAVTALSGSGPAYVFYFIESLIEAGKAAGLSKELAEKLSYQTVLGSAEMAINSDKEAKILRENVTSKGGTTEAALEVMMKSGGLKDIIKKGVAAAKKRSEDLS